MSVIVANFFLKTEDLRQERGDPLDEFVRRFVDFFFNCFEKKLGRERISTRSSVSSLVFFFSLDTKEEELILKVHVKKTFLFVTEAEEK